MRFRERKQISGTAYRVQRLVDCPAAYTIVQLSYFSKPFYHRPKKGHKLRPGIKFSSADTPDRYKKHLATSLNTSDQHCRPECPDVTWFALCWLEMVSNCFYDRLGRQLGIEYADNTLLCRWRRKVIYHHFAHQRSIRHKCPFAGLSAVFAQN